MRPRTKIIATLGPASSNEKILRKMFVSGMDIARLNFSHGSHAEHIRRIRLIQRLNKKMRRSVKIMQDLEGYRMRIGSMSDGLTLNKNSYLYLVTGRPRARQKEIPFDYKGPLEAIKAGSLIYIDDGKIALKVVSSGRRRIKARVITGGVLHEKKGINIPDVDIPFKALTEKDREDLKVASAAGIDYVAQSFVRDSRDLHSVRKELYKNNVECKVFAKIENKKALANIDSIIDQADGIIVARGDLGICVPIYEVPFIQKDIVKRCRVKNKPSVVATQMLDSMMQNILPTRAEVSDVANAIIDTATHLLLSSETAIGKYPHKAVDMMNKIIKATESYQGRQSH